MKQLGSTPAYVAGFPVEVKELRVWVTGANQSMEEGARIPVVDGKANLSLPATSFTTAIGVE